ncbi:DUF4330 domain-containing protein [Prochlorothrix hollandica]|uniref:Pyruvate/2-oxoglutarate dehydrogenase complex,dihydrolipoamide dehydrogenase (E3) component n=1 Tax=Prochlorothrix hollandica PCC 9006 = CALU 1027 TaxID=317619 RepID=A0A0M2PZ55_PROHO|nr:DUF4330 domain-containing protein [Prochlorothrix hollandica]KKI99676.1 pyruvate/2-oxoglutarate dehydrogenase complex,dihydrolipoamide dehydrogenase (E3) component [Prochlorothrix hollandica PCC 9006 = CALU 1027]
MAILDSQGRLFGRISILDIGAVLVIVLVMVGVFLVPGTTGSVAQVGTVTQPVEVQLWTRGLSVADPAGFLEMLKTEGKVNIIIRNQPYGQVELLKVEETPRSIIVAQPDGSALSIPDPRPELGYTLDFIMTVGGEAQITDSGPVLGNSKLKIGTPVELDGKLYNFNTSVIDIKILDSPS